jgi:hypothetical protein
MAIALWDIIFQGVKHQESATIGFETRLKRVMIVVSMRKYQKTWPEDLAR